MNINPVNEIVIVYPIPIKSNPPHSELNNPAKGACQSQLHNSASQQVATKAFVQEGNSAGTINLPVAATGTYRLVL